MEFIQKFADVQVAYVEAGEPSKALLGFCKKNGLNPGDVQIEADAKGVDYVWGVSHREGLPAAEVGLPSLKPNYTIKPDSMEILIWMPSYVRSFVIMLAA